MNKDSLILMALVCLLCICQQQGLAQLTTLPSGGNKKASVSEMIGITNVTLYYSRPAVNNREGKIWGQLVPFGFTDPGFGTTKNAPWRAGANENTTIEFSDDIKIEGQPLPAGKYGFFIAPGKDECLLIFSKNNSSWGSFFYDEKEDALRVKVKPETLDKNVERLKYEFMDQTDTSAVIALLWEKWKIPFSVQVDYVQNQLRSFRNELRSSKGFTWNAWQQAAQFAVDSNTNLDEALTWAETSISTPFIGDRNFTTLSTKAQVLSKLNRQTEADAVMKEALPLGKTFEVHGYARQLLSQKKNKEAFEVFKLNYDKHPDEFTTNVGMARAYSSLGNYKKALTHLQKAQPKAPDKLNRDNIEKMIKSLEEGKDIN
jgi:tetratricopeptide (TPR) repeat protein